MEKEIEKTLESVLMQDYTNYQYIIKDGGSTDQTCMIIEEYMDKFRSKGIEIELLTEKDAGIFDAMNIALRMAKGTFVNYLNAGDSYFCPTVLNDVDRYCNNDVDVIYGHTMCSFTNGSKMVFIQNEKDVVDGIYQQACFIRRKILTKYMFNTVYYLAADYELMLRLYRNRYHFCHVNTIIGIYDRNGLSKKKFGTFVRQVNEIKQMYSIPVKHTPFCRLYFIIQNTFNKRMPVISDWLYAFHTIQRSDRKFIF